MTPFVSALQVPLARLPHATAGQLEARTPRAAFTRRLARVCERIDKCSEVEVRFNPLFLRGPTRTARIRLQRLWVVGSYSRGSPTCGDLDLVFEYETLGQPPRPSARDARIALFGSPPDLRFYAGTPEENSSNVQMADARLVWTGPGCGWRKALSAIPLDPAAGPAPRKTSSLPLRDEQLGGGDELGFLEALIDARDRDEIEWEFIPADDLLLAPIPAGLPDSLGELQRFLEIASGAKTRTLVPFVLRLLHDRYSGSAARRHTVGNDLAYGNTVVRIGRTFVRPSCLLSHLALSEVMLLPHLSKRGPNGAWIVRRGKKHSLTLALARANFWATAVVGESHPLQKLRTDELPSAIQLLEGFATSQGAREVVEHLDAAGELAPRLLGGPELLGALGGAHRIEWDGRALEGRFDELQLTTPTSFGWELLAQLAGEAQAGAVRAARAASTRDPRLYTLSHSQRA